ncbi:hemin uptake protein HemP [Aerolutibacter ruishenii]|uniref:Hemin uptake protein hemP n=1 Tax=Aerolutibacter ruishenii TaxID=686800 RepID=A0A562LNL3_9GAMM|nr:hemin uptake protein HemP [Lysobacter ruishenii]TWI09176.1 hemin uptake protein hemP [Lysobacter ruishenii]
MPLPLTNPVVLRRARLHLVPRRSAPTTVVDAGQVESHALLNGARELLIRHGGELYRLRHTRNDKLILTK